MTYDAIATSHVPPFGGPPRPGLGQRATADGVRARPGGLGVAAQPGLRKVSAVCSLALYNYCLLSITVID